MGKTNKFSFIQEVAQSRKPESAIEVAEQDLEAMDANSAKVEPQPINQPESSGVVFDAPVKKVGRPRGKRSDPDYEQVTAYIRRDTYMAVKIALLQEGQGREFSELLQDLLVEHLSTQNFE